jgi:adenosine kinase
MSHIYVSGSLAYDHIMDFPGLFKDHFIAEKLHNINVSFVVPDHAEHFGGTAGNIAYSLALLGEKPTIISTAGNDFDRYKKMLEAAGVDTNSIHIDASQPTSFAYIMTDKADNQIAAFHPGAGGTPYGDVVPEPDSIAIIAPGCLHDVRALPDVYRGNGTRFLFDPGQIILALTADDLRNGMSDASAVFANDYEFSVIKTQTGWSEADVIKVAQVLVITLGAQGSRVITKDGEMLVKAVAAPQLKDPTGAGDAYRAGYIKGMRLGWTPTKCAQLGSTVAAYAVENVGTQSHAFSLIELQERYQGTYGESLAL